jgi:hypothetical protein
MRWFAARRAASLALGGVIATAMACTTFDGVGVPDGAAVVESLDVIDGGMSCTPVDSAQALATFADAARVCALVGRCPQLNLSLILSNGIPADPFSYSLCLQWLAGELPSSRVGLPLQRANIACMAHAEHDGGLDACSAAGACVGYEAIASNDPRCGQSAPTSSCLTPTDVLRCDYQSIYHCAMPDFGPNMKCMKGSDGQYECGSAGCNDAGLSQCLGDLIDGCDTAYDLVSDINCASVGQRCGEDPSGQNGIVCLTSPGQFMTCNTAGQMICNAGKVEVCADGAFSEWDCTSIGETCTTAGGGARCAAARDGACSPYDPGIDVCNGSVLTACVDGARVCLDCASIGLGCATGEGGPGGRCG